MANKIPCFIRLHGAYKEHATGDYESITAAKNWIRECWNKPYTIVKWTYRMVLEKYNFKYIGENVFVKDGYVAVVYANKATIVITHYSPKVKRYLWSTTYKNLWELMEYLKKNHK